MKTVNKIKLVFPSQSANEGFARTAVAAFLVPLDPTLEELSDIKVAVSEAVTNCIVHAYPDTIGTITLTATYDSDRVVHIRIRDTGTGIEDVEQAMTPMFSTVGGERAGLGFAVMESFMNTVKVRSRVGKGTTVTMSKRLSCRAKT